MDKQLKFQPQYLSSWCIQMAVRPFTFFYILFIYLFIYLIWICITKAQLTPILGEKMRKRTILFQKYQMDKQLEFQPQSIYPHGSSKQPLGHLPFLNLFFFKFGFVLLKHDSRQFLGKKMQKRIILLEKYQNGQIA